jgi:predicted esterase
VSLPYLRNKTSDSFEIEFEYFSIDRPNPTRLFLLLHGFSQRGESLLKKLSPILPADSVILSPNAPFPAPFKTDAGYLEAYAWYFYLAKENRFVIPPAPAIKALKNLITKLGYQKLPVTIIGFSQGGYLAPVIAKEMPVEHIIAVSADYLARYYSKNDKFKLDAIHGAKDEISPLAESKRNLEALKKDFGIDAHFHELPNTRHEVDQEAIKVIAKLL